MLQLRPTFLLSFALFALLVVTVTASSHNPKTCENCFTDVQECKKYCKDKTESVCQFNCECNIGKVDDFCHKSCELGGPESGCPL